AVSSATDPLDRTTPEIPGERKLQAGVQQRGGLAGARGTDDQVPGQLVQVRAPELPRQRGPETSAGSELCVPQCGQRCRKSLAQLRHLGGLGTALCRRQLLDYALVVPPGAAGKPDLLRQV